MDSFAQIKRKESLLVHYRQGEFYCYCCLKEKRRLHNWFVIVVVVVVESKGLRASVIKIKAGLEEIRLYYQINDDQQKNFLYEQKMAKSCLLLILTLYIQLTLILISLICFGVVGMQKRTDFFQFSIYILCSGLKASLSSNFDKFSRQDLFVERFQWQSFSRFLEL